MSSIAHVVATQTIEFHRLHSHRQIVFWRYSTKNFSNFTKNDLLFFLCKTRRREKGLVGFGQLKEIKNLKTKYLFNRYGEELGYHSQQDFYDAIAQTSKTQEIPEILSCLFLEKVTYFKSPIYLSEFGFKLNKQVESYVYLDSETNITSQILQKAKQEGLDLWSETQDPLNHQLAAFSFLYDVALKIADSQLFKTTDSRFKIKEGETLMMNPSIKYQIQQNEIDLYLPIYTQNKKEHYSVLGLISLLKEYPIKFIIKSRHDLSQSVLKDYLSER